MPPPRICPCSQVVMSTSTISDDVKVFAERVTREPATAVIAAPVLTLDGIRQVSDLSLRESDLSDLLLSL